MSTTAIDHHHHTNGSTTVQQRHRVKHTPDKLPNTTTAPIVTTTLLQPLLTTLPLLFVGCCTNVYALEWLLQLSPQTGTLITALQFLLISLYKLPSQLVFTRSGLTLRNRDIPLQKWMLFALQFVAINVLNNAAFSYKISLPLHIILRSGGPVTGMLVGAVWRGKHYSRRKVLGVACLFSGVVLAALSDAHNSPASSTSPEPQRCSLADQAPGFLLLTLALFLSAIMGVWSDDLYDTYGRTPAIASEQLFYGHFLSLPYFALQHGTLRRQYADLVMAARASTDSTSSVLAQVLRFVPVSPLVHKVLAQVSPPMVLLLVNAVTQIACITGVHTLSTQTSALTVSIVLNVRKLVSLMLSIWVFGNVLPLGVVAGAALVFAGVGLYSLPGGGSGSKARLEAKKK